MTPDREERIQKEREERVREERIRLRALEIWREQGCPKDRAGNTGSIPNGKLVATPAKRWQSGARRRRFSRADGEPRKEKGGQAAL